MIVGSAVVEDRFKGFGMPTFCAGRSGSTFGNPGAAGRGDTSAQTQFSKAAGDATKDALGKALGGDSKTQVCLLQSPCAVNDWL